MKFKLTTDNVNKVHVDLLHDDGTQLLPREGFADTKTAQAAIGTIQLDAFDGKVEDLTNVPAFAE